MATMATAACDINATSPRDTFTGVAARSVPVTKSHQHHPLPLPTPPNSISPGLPPHGLRAQLQKATAAAAETGTRLEPIDSDLDLDPQVGHQSGHGPRHGEFNTTGASSLPYDSTGAITPGLLARHHLPEILLNHGPLAIRHIMGYLTTSVPGFAGIPPAKARRLVVSALEGRGGSAPTSGTGAASPSHEGGMCGTGGLHGDVEFEKVGWGRWDARRRGCPPRDLSSAAATGGGIPINLSKTGSAGWDMDRSSRLLQVSSAAGASSSSLGGSAAFSHDDDYDDRHDDVMMLENEADKMSMDGSASASCSEAPDDNDVRMNDDPEDLTDDEDWAAVGAAALRAASYSNNPVLSDYSFPKRDPQQQHLAASFSPVYTSGAIGGLRSFSYNAGMARPPQPLRNFDFAALGAATSDAQEREAIEALLRLGSV